MLRSTNLLFTLVVISIAPFSQLVHALAPQPQHDHGSGCIPAERAALLSFHKGITRDNADILASWHGQDCCRWSGVRCSNQTGHVIKLHLRNTSPDLDPYDVCDDANSLVGEISPSLISLKHLEHLDLSMNCLGPNSAIPQFLGSMENLRYLNLSGMPFTGRVPCQLGNLSSLQYLDLGMSYYYRTYSTDITWLTKLPLMQYLSMTGINLSRIADWPRTLNMIPSLRVINLVECALDTASQSLPVLNLTKLEKLDLSGNNLGHSVASSWFWNLTSLKYLGLGGTRLFGKFPDALGNMTALKVLDLSENTLDETGNLKSLLKNLCCLEILDLSGNFMIGDIGVLMKGLPQCTWEILMELHFHGNRFIGTLPNFIGEFSSLSVLDLSSNNFVELIPPGLMKLVHLTNLDLRQNRLNRIPIEIGGLTALTYLDMSHNNLTGSIPVELGKLKHLAFLFLEDNKLTGSIPPEVMNSTCLTFLDLSSNHFNGSVPTELGSLKNLVDLDLSKNNLNGVITEEHFANLQCLKTIDLSSNNLKIVVDSNWRSPFRLQSAVFSSCQMGPLFPTWLQQLREIDSLDISSTALEDKFPNWFWYTFSQSTYLNISNNQISGSLPAHMEGMALEELYLSSNRLTGGYIPESICKLQQLLYLDLSNNLLEGEIPQCFGIQKLQFLLLSNNSLSGKFPAFLQKNTDMKFLDLAWNKLSGRLPTWIGDLEELSFVLLGHNAFSGNIPADIISLRSLQYLDLSCNNFTGAIPWHLSNLTLMTEVKSKFMNMNDIYIGTSDIHGSYKELPEMGAGHLGEILSVVTKGQQLVYGRTLAYFSLVSLDLSENEFSGEIPPSLSNLTSLAALNLSYNKLSGRIPSGRQLDTLDSDNPSLMYIGNSGLCGPPVHNNCPGNYPFIHGDLRSSKLEFDPLTFHFGLVLGLVVGLWMVFCALLFKKRWRIACFRLLDQVYDQVYVFVVVKWASFAKTQLWNKHFLLKKNQCPCCNPMNESSVLIINQGKEGLKQHKLYRVPCL
ncbi:LRR receptor-like serine/threonine-protein kinase GSO1 [Triticum urartu]|uniref:LRR receptor-like serine/threonine-protein kinase GSO1 n=1 Tax=Triticum urartu TaxID=4572 RepID=M7ZP38_TRIUA|nr:LRR receptor-like serine/threonine-protein kinase GSO1 [Triticum urartu]